MVRIYPLFLVCLGLSSACEPARDGEGAVSAGVPEEGALRSGTAALSGSIIRVTPASRDFGIVRTGTSSDLTVTVQNTSDAGVLQIGSVTSAPPFQHFLPFVPFELQPLEQADIRVRFSPTVDGAETGTLTLGSINTSPSSLDVSLSGTGGSPALSSTPTSLIIAARPGSPKTDSLTLKNGGTAPLTVSAAVLQGDVDGFTPTLPAFPAKIAALGTLNIPVKFSPTQVKFYYAKLLVTSDDPAFPVKGISIYGYGGASVLTQLPALLEFGTQLIGYPASRPLTIRNDGYQSVDITQLVFSGAGRAQFALTSPPPLPLSLASGDTLNLGVIYTPASAAETTGTLSITTDEPDTDPVLVQLHGVGIPSVLAVSPARLDFGTVNLLKDANGYVPRDVTGLLVLTNVSTDVIQLGPMVSSRQDQCMAVDPGATSLDPGQSIRVSVTCHLQAPPGILNTLTFATTTPPVAKAAEATVAAAAVSSVVELTPASLDFGRVEVGSQSAALELRVSNRFSVAQRVLLDPASQLGTEFSVDASALDAPVPAGSTAAIKLTFRPKSSGVATGEVTLRVEGETSTLPPIELTGEGRTLNLKGGSLSCASGTGGGAGLALLAGLGVLALGARRRSRG